MNDRETRRRLYKLLAGRAEFLRIKSESKAPIGSFKVGRRNRYKRLPSEGNYGVLPLRELIVLDVDIHKGGNLDEQIDVFSQLLGVPLRETFTVATPSGGRHFYLLLPDTAVEGAAPLPKASLRSFQQAIRDVTKRPFALIDADLRSDAATAYVLGPGSSVEGRPYTVESWNPILPMSEEGYQNLLYLPKAREEARLAGKRAIDLWASEPGELPPPITEPSQELSRVPAVSVVRLGNVLAGKKELQYHERRAFLKAALHCCYSADAIAEVCVALAVNRDSASQKSIPRSALVKDLNSFTPSLRFHGPYCPVGQARRKERNRLKHPPKVISLEEGLARRQARIDRLRRLPDQVSFRKANPRVIDVQRVAQTLASKTRRGSNSQQYRHALLIVESILQPLANVGAEKFLLSQSFIQSTLDLTASQSSAALRLLRSSGIIEVRDKQAQGFAPTYVLQPLYVHRKLTFHLRRTWLARQEEGHSEPLYLSARDGIFRGAHSRDEAFTNVLAARLAEAQAEVLSVTGVEPSLRALHAYVGGG